MKFHRRITLNLPGLLLLFALTASALFTVSCAEPEFPESYALVYGVADYGNSEWNLNYTDNDAEDFASLLYQKGWNVELRVDSEATLDQLKTDVASISSVIPEDGRFLFYFSGHGGQISFENTEPDAAAESRDEFIFLYGSAQFFIDYNNGLQTLDAVLDVTLSDDSMGELFSSIPAQNRMIVLDACNTGGFIGDGFTVDTIDSDYTEGESSTVSYTSEALNLYLSYSPTDYDLSGSSFMTMVASGEEEESYESSSIGHGIFTYFLLSSPLYADSNSDGYITFIEAYRYIADSISESWNEGTDYDFMPHISAFPVDPVLFKAD